ncbi:MAG: hypothetical protein WDN66_02600 [Candidatus Saccharibacteria bacterium]
MDKQSHSKGDFILTITGEIMIILNARKEDNIWFYYSCGRLNDGTPIEYWVSEYGIKAVDQEDNYSALTHLQEVVA